VSDAARTRALTSAPTPPLTRALTM